MSTLQPQRTHRRSLRNYLLDSKLQLQVTAFSMVVALGVGVIAGGFVLAMTRQLLEQSEALVVARLAAAQADRNLTIATLGAKVTETELDQVNWRTAETRRREIETHFGAERREIVAASAALTAAHRTTPIQLAGGLLVFLLIVAALSLVFTHRIAGPIYRMTQIAKGVTEGKLPLTHRPLRRGDLLTEFFATFCQMIEGIRGTYRADLNQLDEVLDLAERGDLDAVMSKIRAFQRLKRESLGMAVVPSGPAPASEASVAAGQ